MKTYYTGITQIEEAYGNIEKFFSAFHLHEAIEQLDDLFKYACRKDYYKKRSPTEMIFFVEKLDGLCQAAEVIAWSVGRNPDAVIYSPDMSGMAHDPFEYVRGMENGWRDFPRYLSGAEYLNPYVVMEEFALACPRRNWSEVLKDLLEYALGRGTMEGDYATRDVMWFLGSLRKVVEGSGVVSVRIEQLSRHFK